MADNREELGRLVREVWVNWAREQHDVAEHPSWTLLWEELTDRDREVDRRIGEAVAAAERERIAQLAETWSVMAYKDWDGDGIALGVPFADLIRQRRSDEEADHG